MGKKPQEKKDREKKERKPLGSIPILPADHIPGLSSPEQFQVLCHIQAAKSTQGSRAGGSSLILPQTSKAPGEFIYFRSLFLSLPNAHVTTGAAIPG